MKNKARFAAIFVGFTITIAGCSSTLNDAPILLNTTSSPAPVNASSILPPVTVPAIPVSTPALYASISTSCTSSSGICTLSGITAGQTILIDFATVAGTVGVTSITDTGSGSISTVLGPTTIPTSSSGASNPYYDTVFVIANAGAGTHTITGLGQTGNSSINMIAVVIDGASSISPVDVATTNTALGFSANCAPLTTTEANELVITFGNGAFDQALGMNPPAAVIAGNGTPLAAAYTNYSTAGTYNISPNYGGWAQGDGYGLQCDAIAIH